VFGCCWYCGRCTEECCRCLDLILQREAGQSRDEMRSIACSPAFFEYPHVESDNNEFESPTIDL